MQKQSHYFHNDYSYNLTYLPSNTLATDIVTAVP